MNKIHYLNPLKHITGKKNSTLISISVKCPGEPQSRCDNIDLFCYIENGVRLLNVVLL